uniref:Uncharacterized protein n=1 Tax=Neovison vison TaxID=452646 RepID=A0A8C7AHV0_NEOVI
RPKVEEKEEEALEALPSDKFPGGIPKYLIKSKLSSREINQLRQHLGPEVQPLILQINLSEMDIIRCKLNHDHTPYTQMVEAAITRRQRGRQGVMHDLHRSKQAMKQCPRLKQHSLE